jgi:hypothetical protein
VSPRPPTHDEAREILERADDSLLDVIDNLLNKGVVVSGDVVLGLAGIDLIYARLSVMLCAVDKLLDVQERRRPEDAAR